MAGRRSQQLLLALGVGLAAAGLVAGGAVEAWEADAFDVLARAGTSSERSPRVAVILLDEASLDWGRAFYEEHLARRAADPPPAPPAPGAALAGHEFLFPWDRAVYDLLAQFVGAGGGRVLALDVELAGPHPSGHPAGDATLGMGTAMSNALGAPFVIHALNFESSEVSGEEVVLLSAHEHACLRGAARAAGDWRGSGVVLDRSSRGPFSNPILPYREILRPFAGQEQLLRLGAVTVDPDPDGVIRRARPLVVWDDLAFPSLGLAAALALAEAEDGVPPELDLSTGALTIRRDGGATVRLPLTPGGELRLRWRDDGSEEPGGGRYEVFPAHRVLRSQLRSMGVPGGEARDGDPQGYFLQPEVFRDRLVFLGANAAGLRDLKATPVSADYPGVKVHAALAEACLDGEVLDRPTQALRAVLAGLLAALALFASTSVRSAGLAAGLSLLLAALWVAGAALAFLRHDEWLDVVAPVLGVGLSYSAGTTWQWLTEGRKARQVVDLFEHFAPPAVVRGLVARPGDLFLEGETRHITVFFSDIKGFTTLSNAEAMRRDPARLTRHLNAYLTEMTAAITGCGGTVDKYIGDAVVALFGAPLASENHALDACRAALACQEAIAAFNVRAQAEGLPAFVTRIGLFSGPSTVGCVGSKDRFSYTAIGSTVNLASRMEGVNKAYGTLILAGAPTRELAGEGVTARLLDQVRVPGLEDGAPPLEVWEVAGVDAGGSGGRERLWSAYEAGRRHYAAARFEQAAAVLEPLRGDGPSAVLYDRCRVFLREPPPPGWDGAWRLEGK